GGCVPRSPSGSTGCRPGPWSRCVRYRRRDRRPRCFWAGTSIGPWTGWPPPPRVPADERRRAGGALRARGAAAPQPAALAADRSAAGLPAADQPVVRPGLPLPPELLGLRARGGGRPRRRSRLLARRTPPGPLPPLGRRRL